MPARREDFDPNQFQMSIGDHLEELRRRILLGLLGMFPAILLCLIFGRQLLSFLCWPLAKALNQSDINSQMASHELTGGFMIYMKVSFLAALLISGPWIIYQLWKFVSAGLYPNERHYVTKYIPLSILLMFAGVSFVYFIVLPWSLQFFIVFSADLPMPHVSSSHPIAPTTQPSYIQGVAGNPADPQELRFWFDTTQDRLKFFVHGKVRVIPYGPDNLISLNLTLDDYLDLLFQLLLTFALAFQLPLVVMALARIGIVEISTLKTWRRYVYLALAAIAAMLAPGDVVTATVALMIPLIFLYELGIFLARMGPEKAAE